MSPSKKTPLKISCTDTDCDSDLHCFRSKRTATGVGTGGRCRDCGADLIVWERVHRRDLSDVIHTFSSLKNELIRHHFWHVEIDLRAENHARRKGRAKLRAAAEHRIRQSLGAAEPNWDGRQTPMKDNSIFYAQHATASCCRRCVEYWHGIPMGQPLTEEEIAYLTALVCLYLDERFPNLTEAGEKVPSIRSSEAPPKARRGGSREARLEGTDRPPGTPALRHFPPSRERSPETH